MQIVQKLLDFPIEWLSHTCTELLQCAVAVRKQGGHDSAEMGCSGTIPYQDISWELHADIGDDKEDNEAGARKLADEGNLPSSRWVTSVKT